MKLPLSALILSLAVALPAAAGQLYKWTDANGRVQYSDTPPTDRKAETVKGRIGSTSSGGSAAPQPTVTEQEQAFRKRQSEKAEADQKAAQEAAQKQEHEAACNRARGYLRTLEDGGRIAETNAKGEREFYDNAKIKSEKERVRADIEKNCS